jgi:hypothetical protein
MLPTIMPIPGALRLRALHPLTDGDGSCGLIYDLERAAVVEVPDELQFHVAVALETGDLDESLLGWLVGEDLLTAEGWSGWGPETAETAAGPLEAAGWWSLGVYRIEDDVHARIGQTAEEDVLDALTFTFKQSLGCPRVRLHLSWDGLNPGRGLLERIVVESQRLAATAGQEVSYELSLDAAEVTAELADFLAGYPFEVRLLCGTFPAAPDGAVPGDERPWAAADGVRRLLARMPGRMTLHCSLETARLLDVWEWAKRNGVRRLDTIRLADPAAADLARISSAHDYRNDLTAVGDELADELAAQRRPVDFLPLTRIVRRLMRSESFDRFERIQPPGLLAVADVDPRPALDGFDPRLVADLWLGSPECGDVEPASLADAAGEGAGSLPCHGCWARNVCNHSALGAASVEGDDLREPAEEHCSLWRGEVDSALRLYHRLAQTDPIQVRAFFEDGKVPAAAPVRREKLGHLRAPF